MIRFQSFVDLNRPDEYTAPFARLLPKLRDRGITFDSQAGDIIFADGASYHADDERPAVLIDRCDTAALWWMFQPNGRVAHRYLQSDKVLALMKISRYSDRRYYQRESEPVHSRRIRQARGESPAAKDRREQISLNQSEYEKLTLGLGFWAFDACGSQTDDVDFDDARSLDVFCAITVDYDCPHISWHRRAALRGLTEMRNLRSFIARGRVLPPHVYHYLLRQARICVSPWGWGETCHRDYEALAAGCVLIKPKTDFIESLLPLDERHYVACEPDFSDLEEQISRVLGNWSDYRSQREMNRQYVMDGRNTNWLADQCAASLTNVVRNA